MPDLTTVAKVLLYAGATVAIGEVLLPVRHASGDASSIFRGRGAIRPVAALGLLLAPLLWLQAQLAALEIPFGEAGSLLGSGWGKNWGPLAIACAVTALALPRLLGRLSAPLLLIGALALSIAMGGLGHANADERWPLGARALDAVHVMAMGAWIGALVLAIVDDRSASPAVSDESRGILQRMRWGRVSRIATIAAPVAIVTGLLSAVRLLGESTPDGIVASSYGRLLLAKTLIVLVILGLGAAQRRRVHADGIPAARAVRLEVILATVVIVLTAVLTGSEPPE